MQWTLDRNGGFSRCDPAKLFLPPIMDAVYGYQAVNAEAQSRSLGSLLSWTKRMISVRKTSQAFGRGTFTFIRPSNRAVLAYVREYNGEHLLCVANLSRSAQSAELDLAAWKGMVPEEMLGRTRFRSITDQPYLLTLAPYGSFWLKLSDPPERLADDAVPLVPEWVTLVFAEGLGSISKGRTRLLFEQDVLPHFLASRRWFANKDSDLIAASLRTVVLLAGPPEMAFALVDVTAGTTTTRYSLPVAVKWTRFDRAADSAKRAIIAPVRRANKEGVLIEAIGEPELVAAIVRQMHDGVSLRAEGCEVPVSPLGALRGKLTQARCGSPQRQR